MKKIARKFLLSTAVLSLMAVTSHNHSGAFPDFKKLIKPKITEDMSKQPKVKVGGNDIVLPKNPTWKDFVGHKYIPDQATVDEVFKVGGHNFGTGDGSWRYYQHSLSFEKLFEEHGMRFGKMPAHWYRDERIKNKAKKKMKFWKKSKPEVPYIAQCHEPDGTTNCKITQLQRKVGTGAPVPYIEIFKNIKKMLDKHRSEVFILQLESFLTKWQNGKGKVDITPQKANEELTKILKESGLYPMLRVLGSANAGKAWPTFGELRKSNKRFIMIIDGNKKDFPNFDVVDQYQENFWEADKIFDPGAIPLNTNPKISCEMRGGGRSKTSPAFMMNHFYQIALPKETAHIKVMLGVLDLMKKAMPKSWSEKIGVVKARPYKQVNAYGIVRQRAEYCKAQRGIYPDMIMIDHMQYGDDGGAQRYVGEMNMQLIAEKYNYK